MAVEIRPLTPGEMPRFWENLRVGFTAPPRPREEPERPPEILPEWTLCAFEDGDLATTYAAIPFDLYMNGRIAPAAGVTSVSTLPWYRRRGHLRRIMETDFRRLHEEGGPALAILYASMAAIYQRFGYAVVSTHLRYQLGPRFAEFTDPLPVRGGLRPFTRDDLSAVKPVYEAFASARTGYLRRTDYDWQHLTIGYESATPLMVLYEEDGTVLGYTIYWAERKESETLQFGGNVRVSVGDFIWLTPAAYHALWDYLRRIDLARQIIRFRVPVDDPAPALFLEPRQLYATQIDGILARIVDVDRALTQRGYTGEGRLTFEVQDELAPWNVGRWELETGEGDAYLRRTDREAELTLPVAALAPLLFGHYTASYAARIGRVTANDPAALPRWDRLLRTEYAPACGDGF